MLREIRYGVRSLVRWRFDAAIAIATLTIGIGTATSLYVFLRAAASGQTPRIEDLDSVGRIYASSRSLSVERAPLTMGDAQSLLQTTSSFDAIGAYSSSDRAIRRGAASVVVAVGQVTPGFFEVFRARPSRGRLLSANDARSREPVVVLSDSFWRKHLDGGPPGETTVSIDGAAWTVIGVLPPEFRFPLLGITADVWMWMPPDAEPASRSVSVFARLAKGVSWTAAAAELGARARVRAPGDLWTWRAIPIGEDLGKRLGTASAIFLGPALVVLLIGCVNVSCMLLARGLERHVELSVRYALGATRARLIRQLLSEHLLLAGCGGVLGYALAIGLLRLISVSMPAVQAEFIPDLSLDASTLVVALGMSLLASILFGTLPAVRASHRDVAPSLKGEPAGSGGRFVGYHSRDLVVFVELALAVVLVVVAALWLKLFAELQRVTPAFAAAQIVAASVAAADVNTAPDAVASVPGVTGVALASSLPGGRSAVVQLETPGRLARARRVDVQPSFFQTIGLRILRGRSFEPSEANAHAAAVVVSQAVASSLWLEEDPLGARVAVRSAAGNAVAVVIGVSADAMTLGALAGTGVVPPEIYMRFDPRLTREPVLLARVDGEAHAFVRPIEVALNGGGPEVTRVTALMDDRQFARDEGLFLVRMIGVFGLIALGLAASGIFAVLSQSVSQRTVEFGVRMAMGATPREVLLMVIRREAKLIVAAVVTGAAGTVLVTRAVFAELVTISGQDVQLWIAVLVLCGGVAAAAAALATRRIVRLDPWVVLRRV